MQLFRPPEAKGEFRQYRVQCGDIIGSQADIVHAPQFLPGPAQRDGCYQIFDKPPEQIVAILVEIRLGCKGLLRLTEEKRNIL